MLKTKVLINNDNDDIFTEVEAMYRYPETVPLYLMCTIYVCVS